MSENLRIHCVTYNVAGYSPPDDVKLLERLLDFDKPDSNESEVKPDVIVTSFQEVHSRLDKYFVDSFVSGEDEWTGKFTTLLSRLGFTRVKSIRTLGLVLSVFVQFEHLLHIRDVETSHIRLSAGGYIGFKGSVAIRLRLYGMTMCFVTSHLSAHDYNLKLRVFEYHSTLGRMSFKTDERTKGIFDHDYVLWMGDLNFRIDESAYSNEEIRALIKNESFSDILAKDELTSARTNSTAFDLMEETPPSFPPTYKFIVGQNQYHEKRRPAYTDRILYFCNANLDRYQVRGAIQPELSQVIYHSHPECLVSDHRAVSSVFQAKRMLSEPAMFKADEGFSRMSDFGPIIRFKFPRGDEGWEIGSDGKIVYEVLPGKMAFVDNWDWIGVFNVKIRSLDDFHTFAYSSPCKKSNEEKVVEVMDVSLPAAGTYVLIYFGAKKSVYGMSDPFQITNTIPPYVGMQTLR